MNIDPATFQQKATETDSGITIEFHAQNGLGQNTIAIAGIPHAKVEQSPVLYVDGVRYVQSYIDDTTGHIVFVEVETDEARRDREYNEPQDGPSPTLPSEFDDDPNNAVDIDGATD